MRILSGEQGTEQWRANRRGMPTASQFHRILSPAKLKVSEQSFGYLCELVAERLLGVDIGPDATAFMERGQIMEAEAIAYYEVLTGQDTQKVGLCVRDVVYPWSDGLSRTGEVGCSPDRLVGDDGGLELKCPSAAVHVGYLLEGLGTKYRLQVQGALWVTGRAWLDVLSYNPNLPPALVRAFPEPAVFEAFDEALPEFLGRLDEATARLSGKWADEPDLSPLLEASIDQIRARKALEQTTIDGLH